ncbi:MAG: hypothetical protein GX564_05135 [Oligosphaeraceae bacterium]|nr:hypothetical protein [Oligosphaeraceae bacterium]
MLKMLIIVYNISIQEEVMDLLEAQGVTCFTQWPRLVGRGVTTGPRLDNDVWPGANAAVMTVVEEEQAGKLMLAVQAFRDEIGEHEGVKAFQLPVEKMTGDI